MPKRPSSLPVIAVMRNRDFLTTVIAPISRPADRAARPDDRTRQIADRGRRTPRSRTRASGRPLRPTFHRRGAHKDVAFSEHATRTTQKPDQTITRVNRGDKRAGLIRPTSAVHFPCRNASDTDPRTFGAPHGTIAVVNGDRRALKDDAGWDDLTGRLGRRKKIPAHDRRCGKHCETNRFHTQRCSP